jgi:hypothetical protein
MAKKNSRIKKQISSDEIRKNPDTAREKLIRAYLFKNFAEYAGPHLAVQHLIIKRR